MWLLLKGKKLVVLLLKLKYRQGIMPECKLNLRGQVWLANMGFLELRKCSTHGFWASYTPVFLLLGVGKWPRHTLRLLRVCPLGLVPVDGEAFLNRVNLEHHKLIPLKCMECRLSKLRCSTDTIPPLLLLC